nr:hypothetical protein BaRGS_010833 [Batillaria attramentaria]
MNQIKNHASDANIGIDGHIDTAVPSPSFLRVDLHKADCRDNGPFYCNVTTQGSYGNEHSRDFFFSDDQTIRLSEACLNRNECKRVREIDYIEIRRNQFEMIAFANISEASMQAHVFDTFKQPGVVISGLYRCKMMKWSDGHVKAKVAEVRLPACKPGASVHVGGAEKVPNYRGQSPAPWDTELRCSLEASDVHQLISLEISTITNHTRESIVAINAFLNKQQPVRHSTLNFSPDVRDVAFAGRIHIFNATSSYLSIITRVWLSPGEHEQSVLITCTAVYASSSGSLERSMADVVVTYSHSDATGHKPGSETEEEHERKKREKTGHGRNEQDDEGHEKGHVEKGHGEKEDGEKGRVKKGDDKKQQADGRGGKDEEKAVGGGLEYDAVKACCR